MSTGLWKKMDPVEGMPWHLRADDDCWYAREYVSHGGWSASEANRLITNLKKSPAVTAADDRQRYHKGEAVKQFARELAQLCDPALSYALAAIPTSKRRDDPLYDARLDLVLDSAKRTRPKIEVFEPVEFSQSHTSQHFLDDRMTPDEIYAQLTWCGFGSSDAPTAIVLVDDLITCGSHFRAIKRMIAEHHPQTVVAGVFWAKTIWPSGGGVAPSPIMAP